MKDKTLMRKTRILAVSCLIVALPGFEARAEVDDYAKSRATEVWAPTPARVATPIGAAPSDAVVLFDGKDLSKWQSPPAGHPSWRIAEGDLVVNPGSGDLKTNDSFCDIQLHIEWQTPKDIKDENGKTLEGQDRANSGIFFQDRYELQVLDSYDNPTYVNGQAGSIYKQSAPLVNASRAPGQWQTYDVVYKAPRFDAAGTLTSAARMTVFQNGVLVQNDFELKGPTAWIGRPVYEPHGCAPIHLQDHGHPVHFRNIWIRNLQ